MLQVGELVPDFTLVDQDEKSHTLSQYRGKKVVLYFYPKDMTPGCTVQAEGMRDSMNDLEAKGIVVLGVSVDDVKSHKKFVEKHNLNFPLLADTEKTVVQAYGVWKEKSMFGKKYMGIQRDTFLIDEEGKLIQHFEKVNPLKHASQILALV
ncbi:MAG: peroxiredoxin with versatile [Candidatus Parcubacteria bacterium]|jgi:peroxiredoxin Q/BCP